MYLVLVSLTSFCRKYFKEFLLLKVACFLLFQIQQTDKIFDSIQSKGMFDKQRYEQNLVIWSLVSISSCLAFVSLCIKYNQAKHRHASNKIDVEIVSLTIDHDTGHCDKSINIGSYNGSHYCLVNSNHHKR
jgi:hypothetical protein